MMETHQQMANEQVLRDIRVREEELEQEAAGARAEAGSLVEETRKKARTILDEARKTAEEEAKAYHDKTAGELETQRMEIFARAQRGANELKARAEKKMPEAVGRIVEAVLPE